MAQSTRTDEQLAAAIADATCIDAGNSAALDLPAQDIEGDDRVLDGDGDGEPIVDMGVDEVAVPGTCYETCLPVVLRVY